MIGDLNYDMLCENKSKPLCGIMELFDLSNLIESNRKAMNRNWSNQKANPALKTQSGK